MSGERAARRLLAEATQLVARQREIVREVESAGCDPADAEASLVLLEATLRLRRESLEALKAAQSAAAQGAAARPRRAQLTARSQTCIGATHPIASGPRGA